MTYSESNGQMIDDVTWA